MLTKDNALVWIELFANEVIANKELLSDLDAPIGDGDHGFNMARGLAAVLEALQATPPATLTDVFKTVAMQLLSKVGGASGPLYSSAFLAMIKAIDNKTTLTTDEVADMLQAGLESVMMRGKAQVGEKTMIDLWTPAVQAMRHGTLTNDHIDRLVEATAPLKATKGRASYLGDRSIGHIDPGSYSSGIFFKALLKAGVLG
jgi:phosphoenolpyruvate---glycerone phosphotransferase subunit DhaL